jgi:hypothetical protein
MLQHTTVSGHRIGVRAVEVTTWNWVLDAFDIIHILSGSQRRL